MDQAVDDLRGYLRRYLADHAFVEPVTPKKSNSATTHLEVFITASGNPIGIEFDKKSLVNIWLRSSDVLESVLPNLKVTRKFWDGTAWADEQGKGANSNLSGYNVFLKADLVRFGVSTQLDLHRVLDQVVSRPKNNRYLLKVNGELHCPNRICRPESAAEWEGGMVLLPDTGPVLAVEGKKPKAQEIQVGDELWIWTHEDDKFGRGWGLTAKAKAAEVTSSEGFDAVRLMNVEKLPRPFGFRNLGEGSTGSRILDFAQAHRHHQAYLLGDEDFTAFAELVERQSQELTDEVKFRYASDWELEIHKHKDDLLRGLGERRLARQKSRSGQTQFRQALLERYSGRCVLTNCAVEEVLEAAHVLTHTGDPKWDHADNGLLLRKDIHALFDRMLIGINPKNSRIQVASKLLKTDYGKLNGCEVEHFVAPEILEMQFRQFKKANVAA